MRLVDIRHKARTPGHQVRKRIKTQPRGNLPLRVLPARSGEDPCPRHKARQAHEAGHIVHVAVNGTAPRDTAPSATSAPSRKRALCLFDRRCRDGRIKARKLLPQPAPIRRSAPPSLGGMKSAPLRNRASVCNLGGSMFRRPWTSSAPPSSPHPAEASWLARRVVRRCYEQGLPFALAPRKRDRAVKGGGGRYLRYAPNGTRATASRDGAGTPAEGRHGAR